MAARLRLFLAFFVFLCPSTRSSGWADEPAPSDSNINLLAVRGTVLMPDGSPAGGAMVRSMPPSDMSPVETTTDDSGQFELKDMFGNGARLHALTADGSYQTTFWMPAAATRTAFTSPVTLRLAAADTHDVTVLSDGKPVAGARVLISGRSFRVGGLTDADGKVQLHFPAGEDLTEVLAWHPQLGVAGARTIDERPEVDLSHLSLRAPAPHTIHVVDAEGRAVANLELAVSVRTEDSDWIVARLFAEARVRTDESGIAVVPWAPRDGLKYIDVDPFGSDWKTDEIDRKDTAAGNTTVHVRRERVVEGKLLMPNGASAAGILISGFGFGPGTRGDIPYARAHADGTFTMPVASDHGYVLGIADLEWASDPWSGLLLANEGSEPADLAIDVYPATPLTVRVTRGPEREPVADTWVDVSSRGTVEFVDASGKEREGRAGVHGWLTTDSEGVAKVGVGRGEIRVRLASGDWGEERTLKVNSAEPIDVDFHRAWLGNRKLSGRLTLDGKPYKSTEDLIALAWSPRPPRFPLRFPPETRDDGTFEVAFDAENLSLSFVDRQKERSGFAKVGPADSEVEIAMLPTATYSGTLLDDNLKPMVGRTLRIFPAGAYEDAIAEQPTDEQGRFRFEGIAVDTPLRVSVQNEEGGPRYYVSNNEKLFLPGEVRTNGTLACRRLDADKSSARRSTVPLAERVASNCRLAGLNRMRALVILEGDESANVTNLSLAARDDDKYPVVLTYLPLAVRADQLKSDAKALAEFSWPLPGEGEVVLVVLDGNQTTLATKRIAADESRAAIESGIAFLEEQRPPAKDAVALVDEARREAQASGRRVWFVVGGPRCGPCFRLARWMDNQHATLEKDFVMVKVMGAIDQNVAKVLDELPRTEFGIPWHAITEPDGKVLVTSEGPLGNIGMPGSVEGIRHLREMLEKTATKLTPEEIDALAESLRPKP